MARYDRPKAANEIVEVLPSSPQPNIILGMVLMCIAMIGAPVMDVIAKYLGTVGDVAPGVVTFGRFDDGDCCFPLLYSCNFHACG